MCSCCCCCSVTGDAAASHGRLATGPLPAAMPPPPPTATAAAAVGWLLAGMLMSCPALAPAAAVAAGACFASGTLKEGSQGSGVMYSTPPASAAGTALGAVARTLLLVAAATASGPVAPADVASATSPTVPAAALLGPAAGARLLGCNASAGLSCMPMSRCRASAVDIMLVLSVAQPAAPAAACADGTSAAGEPLAPVSCPAFSSCCCCSCSCCCCCCVHCLPSLGARCTAAAPPLSWSPTGAVSDPWSASADFTLPEAAPPCCCCCCTGAAVAVSVAASALAAACRCFLAAFLAALAAALVASSSSSISSAAAAAAASSSFACSASAAVASISAVAAARVAATSSGDWLAAGSRPGTKRALLPAAVALLLWRLSAVGYCFSSALTRVVMAASCKAVHPTCEGLGKRICPPIHRGQHTYTWLRQTCQPAWCMPARLAGDWQLYVGHGLFHTRHKSRMATPGGTLQPCQVQLQDLLM
jgi:hypothetical protein